MCDSDPPAVYRHTTPRARVPHRCCECRRERIQPGDHYHRHEGLWAGEWRTYCVCLRCERVRDALERGMRSDWGECLAFGEMREELRERSHGRHRLVPLSMGGSND